MAAGILEAVSTQNIEVAVVARPRKIIREGSSDDSTYQHQRAEGRHSGPLSAIFGQSRIPSRTAGAIFDARRIIRRTYCSFIAVVSAMNVVLPGGNTTL